MKEVWVLVRAWADSCGGVETGFDVYETEEKAMKQFNIDKADIKENFLDFFDADEMVIDETDTSYQVYRDGEYLSTFDMVQVERQELK